MDLESVCEEIMFEVLKDGYRYQVTKPTIERAILVTKGIDERTSKRWLKALLTLEYITPTQKNIYQINIEKIPHIFRVLKDIPQTHLK